MIVAAVVALVVIVGAVAAVALAGGDDDDDGTATRTTQADESDDTESDDTEPDDTADTGTDDTATEATADDTESDDTATEDTADETRDTTVFPEGQFDSYVDSCVSSATDAAAISEDDARNYCECTWNELQARGVELAELFELGTTGDLTDAPQAVQDAIAACVPELLGS